MNIQRLKKQFESDRQAAERAMARYPDTRFAWADRRDHLEDWLRDHPDFDFWSFDEYREIWDSLIDCRTFHERLADISAEDDELSFRAHNVLTSLRFTAELVEPNLHGFHVAAAFRGV